MQLNWRIVGYKGTDTIPVRGDASQLYADGSAQMRDVRGMYVHVYDGATPQSSNFHDSAWVYIPAAMFQTWDQWFVHIRAVLRGGKYQWELAE